MWDAWRWMHFGNYQLLASPTKGLGVPSTHTIVEHGTEILPHELLILSNTRNSTAGPIFHMQFSRAGTRHPLGPRKTPPRHLISIQILCPASHKRLACDMVQH